MRTNDLGDIGPLAHQVKNEGGIVKVFPGMITKLIDWYPFAYTLIPSQIGHPAIDNKDLDKATQPMFDYIVQNKERTEGKLIIYGHSWGGVLANHIAKRLEEKGIKVDQLFIADAAAGRSSSVVDREYGDNATNVTVFYTDNSDSNDIVEWGKKIASGSKGGPGHRKEGSEANPVINIKMTVRWSENRKKKININHSTIDTESWASIVNAINTFLNSK